MSRARFMVYSGHRAGVAAGGRPWFRWRLVSANNRVLGQSATLFDELPACRRSLAAASELTGAEELRLVSDVTTGLWTWELAGATEVVAVSGRAYQRQRECRQSSVAFCEAAPTGGLRAELLIVPRGRLMDTTAAPSPRRGLSLAGGC